MSYYFTCYMCTLHSSSVDELTNSIQVFVVFTDELDEEANFKPTLNTHRLMVTCE